MNFIKKYILTISGVLIGSVAGYFYWKFVGCTSGTCYIQSNPVRMTLYGALTGGLILNIFQPKTNQKKYEN